MSFANFDNSVPLHLKNNLKMSQNVSRLLKTENSRTVLIKSPVFNHKFDLCVREFFDNECLFSLALFIFYPRCG